MQIFSFLCLGEKKFECKICLKKFTMRGNLTVHMKTHMNLNDLPYQCSECPKKFHDINDLKRHQLSHNSATSESFVLVNADQVKYTEDLPAEIIYDI